MKSFPPFSLIVLLALAAPLHATPEKAKPQTWRLSFELAFGEKSPYSTQFPNLYAQPYRVNLAITQVVLNRIIPIAVKESGARKLDLFYGPAGWGNYPVTPSAQMNVRATPGSLATLMDTIGFLAQQTEVLASRPWAQGDKPTLQIIQLKGKTLASPANMTGFWKSLTTRAHALQGFSPVQVPSQVGSRFGLRSIDLENKWTLRDVMGFDNAIEDAARANRITVQSRRLLMQSLTSRNDWAMAKGGQQYMNRFERRGQKALKARLLQTYQPQVKRWIAAAFQKYAPQSLRGQTAARPVPKEIGTFHR